MDASTPANVTDFEDWQALRLLRRSRGRKMERGGRFDGESRQSARDDKVETAEGVGASEEGQDPVDSVVEVKDSGNTGMQSRGGEWRKLRTALNGWKRIVSRKVTSRRERRAGKVGRAAGMLEARLKTCFIRGFFRAWSSAFEANAVMEDVLWDALVRWRDASRRASERRAALLKGFSMGRGRSDWGVAEAMKHWREISKVASCGREKGKAAIGAWGRRLWLSRALWGLWEVSERRGYQCECAGRAVEGRRKRREIIGAIYAWKSLVLGSDVGRSTDVMAHVLRTWRGEVDVAIAVAEASAVMTEEGRVLNAFQIWSHLTGYMPPDQKSLRSRFSIC